jgi:dihydrofolate reductase
MRKIFSFNMASLDGFFEGPNHELDWHNVDQEFHLFAIEQTSPLDAIIFGRKTYQLMESYWPTPAALADDPEVANLMNNLPKIVFSRTLETVDWNNTKLVNGDAADELISLKQQPGRDLAIFGSADLMSSVMHIIDEHRVMINPVVLGRGNPLFKDRDTPMKLQLVNTRQFDSGNVLLTYQPLADGK